MKTIAFTCALLLLPIVAAGAGAPAKTILGTSLTPAHVPHQSDEDIRNFFDEAGQIGSHVTWIAQWRGLPPIQVIQNVQLVTRTKGMKFHFYLSPTILAPNREKPEIPDAVAGKSFADPTVRSAFTRQAMQLASLHPDYLGLVTEVNFMAQNPPEFEALHSLLRETYQAIKRQYPEQTVTLSFQWDVLQKQPKKQMLNTFADCLDVYAFTTYPRDSFADPNAIPANYYREVRELLPTARLGFSEVGWNSEMNSSEDSEAAWFKRLPELMRGIHPEFVTLALMHDVKVFSGQLSQLNSVGVRHYDGTPKKAWDVLLHMQDFE